MSARSLSSGHLRYALQMVEFGKTSLCAQVRKKDWSRQKARERDAADVREQEATAMVKRVVGTFWAWRRDKSCQSALLQTQANISMRNHRNAVADVLVDDIVKDFGGVGFIYLLEVGGNLDQLDLYVSCEGRPWGSETYRREILRKDHTTSAMSKKHDPAALYRLYSKANDQQIQLL